MAPAKHGGECEQQDGNGDKHRACTAKFCGESFSHQGRTFGGAQHCAGFQVNQAGREHYECGQRADDHRVRKHLENTPHTLAHRFFHIGAGMHHDRGAKARLVGEYAALHTPCDSHLDAGTDDTAAYRAQTEGTLKDSGKDSAALINIQKEDNQGSKHIDDSHKRHQFFRNRSDTLQTAHDNKSGEDHKGDTRYIGRNAESRFHVAGDGIDLAHVADAERGHHTEDREQDSQHSADLLKSLVGAKPVLQIVHGAAAPLVLLIFAPVVYAEHIFGIVGHHAEESDNPHPEDSAGTAGYQRAGDTDDIAGADGGSQGCAQRLEL